MNVLSLFDGMSSGQIALNKANIEILKFLKRHFKTDLRIIKGLKSKNKIISII